MSKFSKIYSITTNFLDRFDDLTPYAILDLFQDISGRHSEEMSAVYEEMKNKSLIWVIARNEVKIFKEPPYLEDLRVITYPIVPTRFYFDREYEIRDKDDNLLVVGRSRWLIVDSVSRTMQPSSLYNYPKDVLNNKEHFIDNFPSLEAVKITNPTILSHKVLPHEIDHNHHYNNTRYAELIYDAVGKKKSNEVERFLVYYLHEVKEGETIDLKEEKYDCFTSYSGYVGDALIFNAQVHFKK